MFFVLLVLHDPSLMNDILLGWREAGADGATILPSTGPGRLSQEMALRDDFPLFPDLSDFLDNETDQNRTLFTVVKDEAAVDKVVAATKAVTGDLEEPNTGILVVLPVLRAYGLHRRRKEGG